MRILLANDGFGDAGGVQSYLDAVVPALSARGHDLAMLHCDLESAGYDCASTRGLPLLINIAAEGADGALARIREWRPDVCYSQNMRDLVVESRLAAVAPIVKFMHGYFGTCIGGQKMHAWPVARPCERTFGLPCLALFGPRHCGELSVTKMIGHYRWDLAQHDAFARYAAIVVASGHMQREYVKHGAQPGQVHVNPLFPTVNHEPEETPADRSGPVVVFFGRMTTLKGGDVLIRAIAGASRRLRTAIRLTLVGDGPQRPRWERLAERLHVNCAFVGWQRGDDRWQWLRGAHLIAVPSTWPEPFGLVGLEAAVFGVPAIAFDVGGVREWLHPGENGYLVPADPPRATALAHALVAAFSRPAELAAMRQRAAAVARTMSLAKHVDRLEEVLNGAAATHAHPARR